MGAVPIEKKNQPIFYVYEHWRPDKNECFLVGKGHGDRAYSFRKRNPWHQKVVAFLRKSGLEPEVRIVFAGMVEREALDLEIAWIAFWRAQGVTLCNVTDGGEGVTGYVPTAETRAKISASVSKVLIGRPCSPETRERIAAAQRGAKRGPNPEHSARLKGGKRAAEHRAKIGAAHVGRKDSPEVCARRAASNRGRIVSPTTRLLLSMSHKGHKPSEEANAKRSASLKLAWAKRKAAANG